MSLDLSHPKPGDTGPVYTETDISRFIVEPYNAISAFLFIILVLFWIWKIRKEFGQHLFMLVTLFVLLIGGVGGTLYHAFRNSELFLVMDWLPIVLLTFAAAGYFFYRLTNRKRNLVWAVLLFFLLQWINFRFVPRHLAINFSYIFMAIVLLLPLVLLLRKTAWKNVRFILLSFGCFLIAIFFRIVDPYAWIPMGTHFLWHLFGALACHFIYGYIYRLNFLP